MIDKQKMKELFLNDGMPKDIAISIGCTREYVRQELRKMFSGKEYLQQLADNRSKIARKTRIYNKVCSSCGELMTGRESLKQPVEMCVKCRRSLVRQKRTRIYTCLNCGEVGEYTDYGRDRKFCDNKCRTDFMKKMWLSKSIQ